MSAETKPRTKEQRTYLAIDLKSFYASVECVERKMDPLTTNLVVADASRTEKTICLAVSPSLKANQISGRARLFEVVQRVKEVNAERLGKAPGHAFTGSSHDANELAADPSLELAYITAVPRMGFYMDYSNYAGMKGKMRFANGKPIVSARYQLWNGMPGCSPEEVAAAVNALPADPKNPDSYVFVIVHAWSGLNGSGEFTQGGNTMAAVERLVEQLDENTRLVSPAQFMERITENCG